jgi:hypothetical protein
MAITTLDGYIASAKQRVAHLKTASRTAVAAQPFSVFDLAGSPGAGVLAIGNTANGVVPTDAVAGYPVINAFGGGAVGYLSRVEYGSSVAGRLELFDRVFAAGAYAFNANTTLTAQPSYAARIPGADYTGTELWIEQVTAGTGVQSVDIGYTNHAGTAGRSTGVTAAPAAAIVGRCWRVRLQAGDAGIQSIQSVVGSVATIGTFNVMVLRRLWSSRVRTANDGGIADMLSTGLPVVFADSAFYVLVLPDSTATGVPELVVEVANA